MEGGGRERVGLPSNLARRWAGKAGVSTSAFLCLCNGHRSPDLPGGWEDTEASPLLKLISTTEKMMRERKAALPSPSLIALCKQMLCF